MAAAAGADLVGMVGPMPSGAGVIDLATARTIAEGAAPWVTPVLLSSGETAGAILAEVEACPVRCVQLVRHVAPEVHVELARARPGLRRIQAIHVEGPEALGLIGRYAGLIDAFLLDSGRPGSQELGGTGRVHDWRVSAEFVRRAPVPVFLAGGLRPENVAEAIATVRPFGVDLCSGVRTKNRLDRGETLGLHGGGPRGGECRMILTIGSVNIDHVHRVAALPGPGETVIDKGYARGLGGKGANQSLAARLAGAEVRHAGAIGADGGWCRERLAAAGIDVSDLVTAEAATDVMTGTPSFWSTMRART